MFLKDLQYVAIVENGKLILRLSNKLKKTKKKTRIILSLNSAQIARERIIGPILRSFGKLNSTFYGNLRQPEFVSFGCRSPRGVCRSSWTWQPESTRGIPPRGFWHPCRSRQPKKMKRNEKRTIIHSQIAIRVFDKSNLNVVGGSCKKTDCYCS